jgi:hypothetical protein
MASAIPGGLKQPVQGMPYNNPSTKDLFRLANIEYQPQLEVSPTYVADILSRSTNIISKLSFSFSIIDKPQGIYWLLFTPKFTQIKNYLNTIPFYFMQQGKYISYLCLQARKFLQMGMY